MVGRIAAAIVVTLFLIAIHDLLPIVLRLNN